MDAASRILLVEDDSILSVMLAQNLRQAGYTDILTVPSGEEALELVDSTPPNVVLMDIELAGRMDGVTTACQIWNAHHIPIIYITSYATPAIIERAKQAEPFGFLVKPFNLKELHATIETALYKFRMEQALQEANQKLAHEIRERQLAEQALRESEFRFRRISGLISDYAYVFTIDADGVWTREWVTDAFTRITGYAPEDVNTADRWLALVFPEDRSRYLQHQRALLTGEKMITEYRIVTKHQDVFWLRDYGLPAWDDDLGRVTQVVGAAQDITDRKQAAEERRQLENQLHQAQRLEALGTLAGGIAHDFNNILGTMIGYTDLLLETTAQGSQEQLFLERVHRAGTRARDLVQQILTFSRTHEFQTRTPTDVAPIIEEAVQFMRAATPANITITCRLEAGCPPILANATQIHQVLVNLCLNAIHAMKATGGELVIVLEKAHYPIDQDSILGLTKGEYLKIVLTDTGPGMSAEVKERIFEPFFTTKQAGEGTGLGLSVVHGIIKGHDGIIAVDSEPGQGTRFRLFFPVVRAAAAPAPPRKESTGQIGDATILVVDDEPALAKLYEIALTKRGYHVTSRCNSHAALELFLRDPMAFDILVVDQDMPDLTGSELGARVLEERPDMPIILVTGYDANVAGPVAQNIGFRRCFTKPLNANELIQAIRTILTET